MINGILSVLLSFGSDNCIPHEITDTNNAGCGRWFPRFHPQNAQPLAHNNDANAPFYFNGVYHVFMQAMLPDVVGWNGAIGIAHLASVHLVSWKVLPPALVPGRWGGDGPGKVGERGGNATGGYYSCSATIVEGVPYLNVPAVWGSDHPREPGTGPNGAGNCDWTKMNGSNYVMTYVLSTPANLSDPYLIEWKEPISIDDGRVDGVQPHGPDFDDTTHAWQNDIAPDSSRGHSNINASWCFAGQTTVCKVSGSSCNGPEDHPEYLQLWESKNGSD
jgi:hypothetical protein